MGPHTVHLDLNYRLDLPDGDIRKLLSSHVSGIDSIQTLLLYDQLGTAIRSNRAFTGFIEHPITHIPYATRSSCRLCCDVDAYFCIFSTYRLALGVSKDRQGYDMK